MNPPDLRRIAVIDFEASSLGSASFPTEIGWAFIDEDGAIVSGACLIRPIAKWTRHADAWSAASERLTGITRDMLEQDGVTPREAMRRLLDAVGDRDLYSDAPPYDQHWLGLLADAAGLSISGRTIGDITSLMSQPAGPTPHRAEADARRWLEVGRS